MLIDTHCHVNFSAYREDADEIIKRSLDNNIWLINVGSQLSTSKRAVEIAGRYDQGVYAVVGLHPVHLHEMEVDEFEQDIHFKSRVEEFAEDKYLELISSSKVVGIGEMGIDYFHMPANEDIAAVKTRQRQTFLQGIKLAKDLDKPIVIHTRPSKGTVDAYDEVMAILDETGYYKGVVHCFGGSREQAKKFIERGLLLSFTGIVTFKNAKDIQEIVKEVPLEKMMVETDAPYLSPEPYRGKRNEPAYVKYVVEKIAELKSISFDKVAAVTTQTAKEFFNINV